MENNINNYYGENIEEMGKKGHLYGRGSTKTNSRFYQNASIYVLFRRFVRQWDTDRTFENWYAGFLYEGKFLEHSFIP